MNFEQKIFDKVYEIRTVLNGQQADSMKKIQIREKCQEIMKECE